MKQKNISNKSNEKTDLIRLMRIDFDNLENHNPIKEECIGVFVGSNGLSAHGKVGSWFAKQKSEKLYLGYNKQVYPQFRLVKDKILLNNVSKIE